VCEKQRDEGHIFCVGIYISFLTFHIFSMIWVKFGTRGSRNAVAFINFVKIGKKILPFFKGWMKLHLRLCRASFDIQKVNNEWINSTYCFAEWIFLVTTFLAHPGILILQNRERILEGSAWFSQFLPAYWWLRWSRPNLPYGWR